MLIFFLTNKFVSGNYLWCHQGGNKEYSPVQCSSTTKECFKFECQGIDSEFVARGCGVNVKTNSVGLKNESCFQAESVCQKLGGISNCHICTNKYMCNHSKTKKLQIYLYIFMIVLSNYIIIANF
ncbi:Hypothetical protein SRAE_X000028500 [Strongyloides ratti]|uniref:Uncharacterized protein n=1 Tax=Strongyloides ratti TaxID=34506 RepID=A0A090LM80_STRRB|nr:Hypothetical protein SRAE_X000028500 [Strongyloides ratti]CEF70955.1 Hypothetical protein SRAE_X000028500 [Strongyloides ratti]